MVCQPNPQKGKSAWPLLRPSWWENCFCYKCDNIKNIYIVLELCFKNQNFASMSSHVWTYWVKPCLKLGWIFHTICQMPTSHVGSYSCFTSWFSFLPLHTLGTCSWCLESLPPMWEAQIDQALSTAWFIWENGLPDKFSCVPSFLFSALSLLSPLSPLTSSSSKEVGRGPVTWRLGWRFSLTGLFQD